MLSRGAGDSGREGGALQLSLDGAGADQLEPAAGAGVYDGLGVGARDGELLRRYDGDDGVAERGAGLIGRLAGGALQLSLEAGALQLLLDGGAGALQLLLEGAAGALQLLFDAGDALRGEPQVLCLDLTAFMARVGLLLRR